MSSKNKTNKVNITQLSQSFEYVAKYSEDYVNSNEYKSLYSYKNSNVIKCENNTKNYINSKTNSNNNNNNSNSNKSNSDLKLSSNKSRSMSNSFRKKLFSIDFKFDTSSICSLNSSNKTQEKVLDKDCNKLNDSNYNNNNNNNKYKSLNEDNLYFEPTKSNTFKLNNNIKTNYSFNSNTKENKEKITNISNEQNMCNINKINKRINNKKHKNIDASTFKPYYNIFKDIKLNNKFIDILNNKSNITYDNYIKILNNNDLLTVLQSYEGNYLFQKLLLKDVNSKVIYSVFDVVQQNLNFLTLLNHPYGNYFIQLYYHKLNNKMQSKLMTLFINNYDKITKYTISFNAFISILETPIQNLTEAVVINFAKSLVSSDFKSINDKRLRLFEAVLLSCKEENVTFIHKFVLNNFYNLIKTKTGFFLLRKVTLIVKDKVFQIEFVNKITNNLCKIISSLNGNIICQSMIRNFILLKSPAKYLIKKFNIERFSERNITNIKNSLIDHDKNLHYKQNNNRNSKLNLYKNKCSNRNSYSNSNSNSNNSKKRFIYNDDINYFNDFNNEKAYKIISKDKKNFVYNNQSLINFYEIFVKNIIEITEYKINKQNRKSSYFFVNNDLNKLIKCLVINGKINYHRIFFNYIVNNTEEIIIKIDNIIQYDKDIVTSKGNYLLFLLFINSINFNKKKFHHSNNNIIYIVIYNVNLYFKNLLLERLNSFQFKYLITNNLNKYYNYLIDKLISTINSNNYYYKKRNFNKINANKNISSNIKQINNELNNHNTNNNVLMNNKNDTYYQSLINANTTLNTNKEFSNNNTKFGKYINNNYIDSNNYNLKNEIKFDNNKYNDTTNRLLNNSNYNIINIDLNHNKNNILNSNFINKLANNNNNNNNNNNFNSTYNKNYNLHNLNNINCNLSSINDFKINQYNKYNYNINYANSNINVDNNFNFNKNYYLNNNKNKHSYNKNLNNSNQFKINNNLEINKNNNNNIYSNFNNYFNNSNYKVNNVNNVNLVSNYDNNNKININYNINNNNNNNNKCD